jgi:hypothetical protein
MGLRPTIRGNEMKLSTVVLALQFSLHVTFGQTLPTRDGYLFHIQRTNDHQPGNFFFVPTFSDGTVDTSAYAYILEPQLR